jgi:membrane-bound acyltransferase YfiQ involved in biofilm formation
MFNYPFPTWDKIFWIVVLGAAFTLEFLGIFKPGEATLTRLICNTLPAWLRAMILGWLFYHFLLQNPA